MDRLLLEHGIDVETKNIDSETGSYKATLKNPKDMDRLLLALGIDKEALKAKGTAKVEVKTELFKNPKDTDRLLLEHGIDVKTKNTDSETGLHYDETSRNKKRLKRKLGKEIESNEKKIEFALLLFCLLLIFFSFK